MVNLAAEELSGSQYASNRKELLSLVKQLRAMGAQADLDLPRVTVIGNQSAGKSSVVEAISGITVPRDSGTCTRCPMECRLSSSECPWSCQVSIRWEFQDNGNRKDQVLEVPFGPLITDKANVELALRRAQAAILCPQIESADFLTMDEEGISSTVLEEASLSFSKNVVCVDLEGPDLTDLSFIDLPGIISNADEDIVELVKDLVVSHIKGKCLILVALPMTDDIDNQIALRLARREDPEGKRTIGVLTKPDLLGVGSKARDLWLDVIEGRRHPLIHGYYCTLQPDDDDRARGITSAVARTIEKEYFSKTSPWSGSLHRQRFGTSNLVSTLSKLLVQVIKDTIPRLRTETISCLEKCRRELSALPEPITTDPVTHMLHLVKTFSHDVDRYVQGGRAAERLIHQNKKAYEVFKDAIRSTAPNFQPYPTAVVYENGVENSKESEDDDKISNGNSGSFCLADMRKHIEESITRELPGNVPFDTKVSLIDSFQETWQTMKDTCFDNIREYMLETLCECITKTFKRYGNLQSHVSSLSELVESHYQSCSQHVDAILEVEMTPFTQNTHYLETSKAKWLARYKDIRAGGRQNGPDRLPNLGAYVSPPVDGGHARVQNKSRPSPPLRPVPSSPTIADIAIGWRQWTPAPTSPAAISIDISSDPRDLEKINSVLALLADIGYSGLSIEDLGKLNPPDEYEAELNMMAEVRGYFQVSYKRVIDNVPSLIDLKFVKAIPKVVQNFLIAELGLGAADAAARCVKYLAEDPTIVACRDELVARQKRLESVKAELQKLGL